MTKTNENDITDEKVEVTGEEKQRLLLMVHGLIMTELLQYPRFQAFLAANYSIEQNIDDNTKDIGFTVREFTKEEITTILSNAMKEAQSSIVTASEADLKNLDKISKIKQ